MQRFAGTVEEIGPVEVSGIVDWITGIPLTDWPQQSVGQLWPAMQTDLAWHGFGAKTDALVGELMGRFPGCVAEQRMLSVVMPGRQIDAHTDSQPPNWICRVHVPLQTNPQSQFVVGGKAHWMEVGRAYRVNTEAVHAVRNRGATPRIHLMWDVKIN